jgi:3-hydroxy acid dehydrogenase / malonic semialdehyde reductase
MKHIFITGATSGFGEATANEFASKGFNVTITGRRSNKLATQKNHLQNKYKIEVQTLCFDVRNNDEVNHAINAMPEIWKGVDILVNNAGLAIGKGSIANGLLEDWNTMIDTNIKGLLNVSQAIIPLMKVRKKGHIINIGSIAGKEVYEGGNVYSATKHAVDALSKAMRIDLLSDNIKVTQICPGAAETEFSIVRFKGDITAAKKVYDGFQPLLAIDIAEAIYFVASRPSHVNINDMIIMPTAQASAIYINKI